MVTWNDAWSPVGSDSVNAADVDDVHHGLPIWTVGWLLKDDAAGVTICAEYTDDDDYRSRSFIPRPLVVSIHRLARSRKLHEIPAVSDPGLTPAPTRDILGP